jgi:hypothetical protein
MHDPHTNLMPAGVGGFATLSLWSGAVAQIVANGGLSLQSVGTLVGGFGTLVFALVAASRERRAWLDRRAKGPPP